MIAAVEDARAAQEREAESLRDRLRGLGKLSPQITGGATRNGYDNGNIGTSSPVGNVDGVIGHGGDDDRNMKGEEVRALCDRSLGVAWHIYPLAEQEFQNWYRCVICLRPSPFGPVVSTALTVLSDLTLCLLYGVSW